MGKYIKNPHLLKIINWVKGTWRDNINSVYIRRAQSISSQHDILQGEKLVALADNRRFFYCHTHEVDDFLKNPPTNKFVLISHNSDHRVTHTTGKGRINFTNMPDHLARWFSQNVDVTHNKIESLPIGLENIQWFPKLRKIEKLMSIRNKEKSHVNWLYVNHNTKTNPAKREFLYAMFERKNWCTVEHGTNNYKFNHYLSQLHNHKFVLAPEGNGIDTHRTWEALYINTIPIEKRNKNNIFYTDLPICFVDDWEEVTEEFLEKEYERITNSEWNLEKLTFTYWKNRILNTSVE